MNKKHFDKQKFWNDLSALKKESSIKISKKPHSRSAKRITILISAAYLANGGSVHWVQCLESAFYRQCKAKRLDCDRLEMEDNWQSYACRRTKGPGSQHHGKKMKSNEFDEWNICTTDKNSPKAELFANILTDYLAMEECYDDQELPGSCERERASADSRHQKRFVKKAQEARFAARESVKNQQDLHCR